MVGKKENIKEHIYRVEGMHCSSCEILIEKKLLEIGSVESVDASAHKGRAVIEYRGERPTLQNLNRIFAKEGYVFSDFSAADKRKDAPQKNWKIFGISLVLIGGFLFLNRLGLASLINVSAKSALPAFFAFGILAGFSTCAALVGGIVLSMSKQWMELYSKKDSILTKFQPHLMFNAGRIISFALLGLVLGGVGSKLQISLGFTSMMVILISVMMFFLAMQMLGVKAFQGFQFTLPKSLTRYVADDSKFQGKFAPFMMGALTFLLPCGFTITVQSIALLSGDVLQGGIIMFLFALGTAPALLLIGLSSVKFFQNPHMGENFLRVAGALVLFFALFNINSQLNILGLPSFSNVIGQKEVQAKDLAPIVDGKQILKMNASSFGYSPNKFKVRAGIPVRWEITDKGTSGCTNAVISRALFNGQISLTRGKTSVKEFTPQKAGRYKFSCWMGMISGIIEVVDENKSSGLSSDGSTAFAVSDVPVVEVLREIE
ncbi:MAG: sulfite exporter TauE/SafE family protein [Candidatus Pacebacteria bacterium]|nr:sulfite exporter TauE/SafE family protein [Candidatus Paceibacterota bacterium]